MSAAFDGSKWTILEDIGGGLVRCQCECGTIRIVDKYSVTHGKSLSCGCVKRSKPLKGKIFNNWEVLEDIDNKDCYCKCLLCNTVKIVQKAHLKNGSSKSCGCNRKGNITNNIVGKRINYWLVLDDLGDDKILCKCDCGTTKICSKYQVTHHKSKSCGCMSSELKRNVFLNDLTNLTINDWTVVSELGHGNVLCKCICGNLKVVQKASILNGTSKSCGHKLKFKDLTNMTFGKWVVLKELGYGLVQCKCSCSKSTIKILQKQSLLRGKSKSCGCDKTSNMIDTLISLYNETCSNRVSNPRDAWQINAIKNRDNLLNYIQSIEHKPSMKELANNLNIHETFIGKKIRQYDLYDYIQINGGKSLLEKQVLDFLKDVYNGEIITKDRIQIHPYELDIYIPDKKLAIEFNGNYWHSEIFKDKYYHQNKTIDCAKQGIRLIHIFEYEWVDEDTQIKIKSLLKNIVSDRVSIYARNTEVCDITSDEANNFCDKYHLQNCSNSSIHIGLRLNNEIISVMTFNKPRFNDDYEYELIRYCVANDICILGGAEKLFKYFLKKYRPTSVISYTDISKFTGNVYTRLGFKPIYPKPITLPNYVWYNTFNKSILKRYETMKHKLIEQGIGTKDQTEVEIMTDLGYIQIYDSGNLRLEWHSN